LCILVCQGDIISLPKSNVIHSRTLNITINSNDFDPDSPNFIPNVYCGIGFESYSVFDELSTSFQKKLVVDPTVMKADCVGVILLPGCDINFPLYMLFSPGTPNVVKFDS
jgi:hypothetical protein